MRMATIAGGDTGTAGIVMMSGQRYNLWSQASVNPGVMVQSDPSFGPVPLQQLAPVGAAAVAATPAGAVTPAAGAANAVPWVIGSLLVVSALGLHIIYTRR